jgi:uncharacterized membrane protein (UPF0136 family)
MNSFADAVLWVYILLLLAGGLFGFFKARSKVSLITSVVSAAILALCALRIVFQPYMADVVMILLIVVFAIRLTKTKKFMPSGMMLALTAVALALHNLKHLKF